MKNSELAKQLGHKEMVVQMYEDLKEKTMLYNNDHIAELDIIYFLRNILWSVNFELVATVIKDGGWEERLDQWKEALGKLNR